MRVLSLQAPASALPLLCLPASSGVCCVLALDDLGDREGIDNGAGRRGDGVGMTVFSQMAVSKPMLADMADV